MIWSSAYRPGVLAGAFGLVWGCVLVDPILNEYSAGYAITRAEYAVPELVPELWHALARPVP